MLELLYAGVSRLKAKTIVSQQNSDFRAKGMSSITEPKTLSQATQLEGLVFPRFYWNETHKVNQEDEQALEVRAPRTTIY